MAHGRRRKKLSAAKGGTFYDLLLLARTRFRSDLLHVSYSRASFHTSRIALRLSQGFRSGSILRASDSLLVVPPVLIPKPSAEDNRNHGCEQATPRSTMIPFLEARCFLVREQDGGTSAPSAVQC